MGISPRGRDDVRTTDVLRKFPCPRILPYPQVALVPGDSELPVALRALHVDGVPRDGCAGAAHRADGVAIAPMIREVLHLGRARHDGPVARSGEEGLQESPGDADPLTPRDLEHRVLGRQAYDAIPGAPPEAAVHVLLQAGPGPRQGISGRLHGCNLNAPLEPVNPEMTWVSDRAARDVTRVPPVPYT